MAMNNSISVKISLIRKHIYENMMNQLGKTFKFIATAYYVYLSNNHDQKLSQRRPNSLDPE